MDQWIFDLVQQLGLRLARYQSHVDGYWYIQIYQGSRRLFRYGYRKAASVTPEMIKKFASPPAAS